jgi:hypothetical protein
MFRRAWITHLFNLLAAAVAAVGIFLIFHTGAQFDLGQDVDDARAAWRANCPENYDAYQVAFAYERDSTDPALQPVVRWRAGAVEDIHCQIFQERYLLALFDSVSDGDQKRGELPEGFRYTDLFSLYYFVWLKTGEYEAQLADLSRDMAPQSVAHALSMRWFNEDVRPEPRRDETGRIHPDDPGYRFVEIAREAEAAREAS